MVFVSIHNIEKIEINKSWLDDKTYVVRIKFTNNLKELTDITLFSKHSETFDCLKQNTTIENLKI